MSAAEIKASDVLYHLDEAIILTKQARLRPTPFSPEFMDGYLRGLTDIRKYLRSESFAEIVRTNKETPTNAHLS